MQQQMTISKQHKYTKPGKRRVDTYVVQYPGFARERKFRSLRQASRWLGKLITADRLLAAQSIAKLKEDLEDEETLTSQLVRSENNKFTQIDQLKKVAEDQAALIGQLQRLVTKQQQELVQHQELAEKQQQELARQQELVEKQDRLWDLMVGR